MLFVCEQLVRWKLLLYDTVSVLFDDHPGYSISYLKFKDRNNKDIAVTMLMFWVDTSHKPHPLYVESAH